MVFVTLEVDAIAGDGWLIYQGQHDAEVRTTHLGTSNSNLILTGRQVCILLSCSFLMKFVFRINGGGEGGEGGGHKLLFCLLRRKSRPRTLCSYYLRVGCSGMILDFVLGFFQRSVEVG